MASENKIQEYLDTLEQDKIMGFRPASFEEKFFVKEDIIKDMEFGRHILPYLFRRC